MRRRLLLLSFAIWSASISAGKAQTAPLEEVVNAGSIGLRGGYDTNPTDTVGAHGSLFVTQTVSYDYLRGSLAGDGLGLKVNVSNTVYDPNVAAPSTNAVAAANEGR
jgi:hypothetical protein